MSTCGGAHGCLSVLFPPRSCGFGPHLSVYTVQIDLGHLAPLELATTLLEGEGRRDGDGGTHWPREALSGGRRDGCHRYITGRAASKLMGETRVAALYPREETLTYPRLTLTYML